MRPATRQSGFTLIELMVVVAIIAILATVAVVAYTKMVRKAHAAEIGQMFAEFKAKEEAYSAERGKYLGLCPNPDATTKICTEGDFFPSTLTGNEQDITASPNTWKIAKIQPGKSSLYCQYEVVAGAANDETGMGTYGKYLWDAGAPTGNWWYMVAQCDWDHDSTVNSVYYARGDKTTMAKENEGR